MITSIINIVLKVYLSRNENLRFPMLSQLMLKSANYLRIYYQNLIVLVNSNEETKKLFYKSSKKTPISQWKIMEEASDRDSCDSKLEESVQKLNLFTNNMDDDNEEKLNFRSKFEPLNKKSVMFFLDEFWILFLKQLIALAILEKRLFFFLIYFF